MKDISELFDFKRQMWASEVRREIDRAIALAERPPKAPPVNAINARIDARLGVNAPPPPPCSECGAPLPRIHAVDQKTCGPVCGHARRCRLLREANARRTEAREARKLSYHEGISVRFARASREMQDAAVVAWCADWYRRAAVANRNRLGVRHAP